jgi:hypothetical protein
MLFRDKLQKKHYLLGFKIGLKEKTGLSNLVLSWFEAFKP